MNKGLRLARRPGCRVLFSAAIVSMVLFCSYRLVPLPREAEPSSVSPKGWTVGGTDPTSYQGGIRETQGSDETSIRAAFLRSKPVQSKGFAVLAQWMNASDFADKRVRLRAMVKSDHVRGWAGLWMQVLEHEKQVAADAMQDRPIRASRPWQSYDVVLDIPKHATEISFGLLLWGEGEVWIDKVTLQQVSKDIAVTGGPDRKNSYSAITQAQDRRNQTQFAQFQAPGAALYRDRSTQSVADELVSGWYVSGDAAANYQASLDPSELYDSRPATHLRSISRAGTGFGTLQRWLNAEPYAGKRVRLRIALKSRKVDLASGAWMRIESGGETLAFSHKDVSSISGSTSWKTKEIVLDVPREATDIVFGAYLKGPGDLWTDAPDLEVVNKDVKTSRAVHSPPKEEAEMMPQQNLLPLFTPRGVRLPPRPALSPSAPR